MKYTATDVRKAESARTLMRLAKTEECSPEAIIRSDLDEELNPARVAQEIADFKAGQAILNEAKLVQAQHRTTVPQLSNGQLYHEFTDADSPTVLVEAGWIATSQAYQAVALKVK